VILPSSLLTDFNATLLGYLCEIHALYLARRNLPTAGDDPHESVDHPEIPANDGAFVSTRHCWTQFLELAVGCLVRTVDTGLWTIDGVAVGRRLPLPGTDELW